METKKEKLRAELLRAKEKASEWTARARDIERQITECENTEILQVVRSGCRNPGGIARSAEYDPSGEREGNSLK